MGLHQSFLGRKVFDRTTSQPVQKCLQSRAQERLAVRGGGCHRVHLGAVFRGSRLLFSDNFSAGSRHSQRNFSGQCDLR